MRNTTLRLSAPAVKAMIEADAEFKLELQRCVVAEITRRLMPSDLDDVYMDIIRLSVNKARSNLIAEIGAEGKAYDQIVDEQVRLACHSIRQSYYTNNVPPKKRDEIAEAVKLTVASAAREEVQAAVGTIETAIQTRVEQIVARLDVGGKIDKAVNAHVDAEIERRVAERLGRIAEAARGQSNAGA